MPKEDNWSSMNCQMLSIHVGGLDDAVDVRSAAVLEARAFITVEDDISWEILDEASRLEIRRARLAVVLDKLVAVLDKSAIFELKIWKLEFIAEKLLDKVVPNCRFWIPSCCEAAVELASEVT